MALNPAFNKPIPGSSLTNKEKGFAFERPPQITNPDEAVMLHIERLSDEDMVNNMLDVLGAGIDVNTLTKGILRSAVGEGVHSIDISLLIAPVIHELIKTTAIQAGIEYEEGFDNPQEEKKRSHMRVMQQVAREKEKRRFNIGKDMPKEESKKPAPMPMPEPPAPAPAAPSLMSRPVKGEM